MDFTRLRLAELDLTDHVERVAALRRQLPNDTVVDDYQLIDVASSKAVPAIRTVHRVRPTLILYHFMYSKAQNRALSSVHDVDRRVQLGGSTPGAECRLRRGRGGRACRHSGTRGVAGLGQSAAAQCRRQQLQI